MTKFEQVATLAAQAGLQVTKADANWLNELSCSTEGLVVKGRATKSGRGDCYQYLVFSETELIAIGSEQGNYAGGIDWRKSSNHRRPNLPVELQKLLSALTPHPQGTEMTLTCCTFEAGVCSQHGACLTALNENAVKS